MPTRITRRVTTPGGFGPQPGVQQFVDFVATPATAVLSVTGAAPNIQPEVVATPPTAVLSLDGVGPKSLVSSVVGGVGEAVTRPGGFGPRPGVRREPTALGGAQTAALSLSGKAPTAVISGNLLFSVGRASLSITALAPGSGGLGTAQRRKSASAVPPGVSPGVTPDATPDEAWRRAAAGTYAGITGAPTVVGQKTGLVLTSKRPAAVLNIIKQPPTAALAKTGVAPTAVLDHLAAPSIAALSVASGTPQADLALTVAPAAAVLSLLGERPEILRAGDITKEPPTAALSFVGVAPLSVKPESRAIQVPASVITISGLRPTIKGYRDQATTTVWSEISRSDGSVDSEAA